MLRGLSGFGQGRRSTLTKILRHTAENDRIVLKLILALYYKKDKMASNTIAQFATELKMPADLLLTQLQAAGVQKNSTSDPLTKDDKDKLLNHLRRIHGAAGSTEKQKITVMRKSTVASKAIEVEVRKKRLEVMHVSDQSIGVTNFDIASIEPTADPKPGRAVRWSQLDSIEISNFKAIKNIKIPLSDVTIMVGPNSSGKSSVLQAIHWAARAASYIPPKNQSEVVSFERLDYSPSSEPLTTAYKGELSSDTKTDPTTIVFNHIQTDMDVSAATIRIWAARNRGGISVHIEGGSAVTPFKQRDEVITAYIPGLAGLSEKETILVKPLLRRQAASGDAGGVLRNVLFNIASRQPGENDNEAAIARVRRLNQLIQIVHPGVNVEVSFDDREDINIRAVFDDSLLSGVRRPLESAATGVLQAIQIFAYLILFRPKLLLIDEPDAHLHPDKQERLIEALEHAASEFGVQIIITTHSPNIVRAASSSTQLLWVKNGQLIDKDDETIRALLGWGGLDKKILFFVEDEDDRPIRAILRQWPNLNRQIAICRCFGIDNLPRNALLEGLLSDNSIAVSVLIHRDRDFMTEVDSQAWSKRYKAERTAVWITEHVDAEGYFCQTAYLAALYGVDLEIAENWIKMALSRCSKVRDTFYEKRKLICRILYEYGGGDSADDLWEAYGQISKKTVLGKTLHKALKTVLKEDKQDERLVDRFVIPKNFEMANELKNLIEIMLAK